MHLALAMHPLLPSALYDDVGSLNFNIVFRGSIPGPHVPLSTLRPPLQTTAHDSGPMWLAMPSPYDSFIHDTSPVFSSTPPSSPGESHPQALTEPYVIVSRHTARTISPLI